MKVYLPTQFEKVTKSREIDIRGNTVGEILGSLILEFPELENRLLNKEGKINRFLNVFLNDEDINFLACMKTKVKESDSITILPAIAGG